jgi:hypothetical protein
MITAVSTEIVRDIDWQSKQDEIARDVPALSRGIDPDYRTRATIPQSHQPTFRRRHLEK